MNLSQLIQWIAAHPWEFLGRVAAASMAFAAAWASIKAAVQKVTGRAMPRNALTTTLDVLAELAMNIPGAINRWARAGGSPSIFAPPSTPSAPPSRTGQSGRATVGAIALLLATGLCLVGLGAVLTGCPKVIREPALPPPPAGCDAGATLCHEGAPWRCGPNGQWSQADRRCDRLSGTGDGGVGVLCCATPSALRPSVLVHSCVPSNVCAPEVSR